MTRHLQERQGSSDLGKGGERDLGTARPETPKRKKGGRRGSEFLKGACSTPS